MVAYSGIWELFNDLNNSHRVLEQFFFQIIRMFLHFFHSKFDVRRSSSVFSALTSQNSPPLSFHMTAKTKQPTGLPVMLQQGAARFAVAAFNPALGTSYDVQIQFAFKQIAFGRMAAQ